MKAKNYSSRKYGDISFHALLCSAKIVAKKYKVTTKDGYILKLFRLIHPIFQDIPNKEVLFL